MIDYLDLLGGNILILVLDGQDFRMFMGELYSEGMNN